MAIDNPALWARIRDYQFEPSSRIAKIIRSYDREMGLKQDHMLLCIRDYRRFMYILGDAQSPAKPSAVVEKVWRFHAIRSPTCYEKFCRVAVGQTVMPDQASFYSVADLDYLQTRILYQEIFSEPPNIHIWPTARSRLHVRVLRGLGAALLLWPFFWIMGEIDLRSVEGLLCFVSLFTAPMLWVWADVASPWSVCFQRRGKRSDYSDASDTGIGDDDGDCDDSDSDGCDSGDSDGGDGD